MASTYSLASPAPAIGGKVVFLGDSITDGHTYPLLVQQAMAEAKFDVPIIVNAGIGNDTAKMMRARLARDVFVHHPDTVTVSAGINDALQKVDPSSYEADITAIVQELKAARVRVILLNTTILGPKQIASDTRREEYNAILRKLAQRENLPLADVDKRMKAERDAGRTLLDGDDVHPNFAGHRVIARAVLDALGYAAVEVPNEMKLLPMPGIVTPWKLIGVHNGEKPLTDIAAAELKADDRWKRYSLPESEPVENVWLEQERRRGFAISIAKFAGESKVYRGIAEIESPKARKVFFNTGGYLQRIWLNGKKIYNSTEWTGWHAGKERVAADLIEGRNTIVIECGPQFFLSITDDRDW